MTAREDPRAASGRPADNCPGVAVFVATLAVESGELRVLLVSRSAEPFRGLWSLPGGVLAREQSLDEAATHKLRRETGVTDVYLEQLYTFHNLDGRGSVAVAYFALWDSRQAELAP